VLIVRDVFGRHAAEVADRGLRKALRACGELPCRPVSLAIAQ
jgi:hypothetical protein